MTSQNLKNFFKVVLIVPTLLFALVGCSTLQYSMQVVNKTNYIIKASLSVNAKQLTHELKDLNISRSAFDTATKSSIEDSISGSQTLIRTVGENVVITLEDSGTVGGKDSLVTSSQNVATVSIPLNKIFAPLKTLASASDILTKADVKVDFPGYASTANYSGKIFSNSVTWDKAHVTSAIDGNAELKAIGNINYQVPFNYLIGGGIAVILILLAGTLVLSKRFKKDKIRRDQEGQVERDSSEVSDATSWANQQIAKDAEFTDSRLVNGKLIILPPEFKKSKKKK